MPSQDETLFKQAIQIDDPAERSVFLDQACGELNICAKVALFEFRSRFSLLITLKESLMSLLRKLLLSFATAIVLAGVSDVALAQKGGGKTTTPKLSLTISPSTIREGNSATGTVTHNNSSTTSSVTVTLRSSDTSEATVPVSVIIPAGTNLATFTVTAVNDGTVDGDQSVTISASATGYSAGSTVITVSDKPTFEYRTEVILGGANSIGQVNGITNNSRVYGWMSRAGYVSGFVYDQVTGNMYELNQITALTTQIQTLAGPGFGLNSVVGMNESGLMTGYIQNGATRLGIAIDTTVNGQYSPDPADWVIQLLPDFGSTYTYGRRINEFGDILGTFLRTDGTYGAYLYNPWLGGAPAVLPDGSNQLNDLAEVAGVDDQNRAFLCDALTGSVQYFTDAEYVSVNGLNDAGVFSGSAWISVPRSKGGGTTTMLMAFRHDGTLQPIGGTRSAANSVSLNESDDVACHGQSLGSMLSHTGFAPDYKKQLFSLSSAIAADDPLKAEFVNLEFNNREPTVHAINDRNATGYPQLVCLMNRQNPDGTWYNVAVILTPYPVP